MNRDLFSAMKLLEENGFHVTRAYEEDQRDAGNTTERFQHEKTGAIWLRVTPKKADKNQSSS
ncbi:MAG: hypothetical protein FWB99_11675 [Treponema sp.]|nr:hypothetical protein [Treponema sp.]MCL2233721.1 hypothetical protein [Treponema sp.]